MDGLVGICYELKVVLKEVLVWIGGQLFLIQKVCKFLIENGELIVNLVEEVVGIIRLKIVYNWEVQDVLEYFKIICDCILRKDE